MKCLGCDYDMIEALPLSTTTDIEGVEVGIALTMHGTLRKGKRKVKETIPIGAFVCPACGRVALQLDEKQLSIFRKYHR